MNILGMRDLQSLGWFPIKRAMIKIDMNRLDMSGEKNRRVIQVKAKQPGGSPNVSTIV